MKTIMQSLKEGVTESSKGKLLVAVYICEHDLHVYPEKEIVDNLMNSLKRVEDYLFNFSDKHYLVYENEEQLNSFIRDYSQFFVYSKIPVAYQGYFKLDVDKILKESFDEKRRFVLYRCSKHSFDSAYPDDSGIYRVCRLKDNVKL